MLKRRRQYRTKPEPKFLKVSVGFLGERAGQSTIEHVSIGGISLSFPSSSAPRCSLREVVPVEIRSPLLPAPLVVPSLVTSASQEEGRKVYGFEFIDWLGLLSQLPEALREIFNQRRDHRVAPDPDQPVEATAGPIGSHHGIPVEVVDISVLGVSFLVKPGAEGALRNQEVLELLLSLPGTEEMLRFRARVTNSILAAGGVRYGVHLLADEAEGLERSQELLVGYVARRRREILGLDGSEIPAEARTFFGTL